MNHFIYKTWFIYKILYDEDGEKTRNEKNPRLVTLPSSFCDMEANCFPVSENVENKPDLPPVGVGDDLMP